MKRRVREPRALEQIPVWADIAPARVTISDEETDRWRTFGDVARSAVTHTGGMVTEAEVFQVLRKPGPAYRGDRNSRMKSGQTEAGRHI